MSGGIAVVLQLNYVSGDIPEWTEGGYLYLFAAAPSGHSRVRKRSKASKVAPQWIFVTSDGEWNEVATLDEHELAMLEQSRFGIGDALFQVQPTAISSELWFGIPERRDVRVSIDEFINAARNQLASQGS